MSRNGRTKNVERLAEQAWGNLTSTVESGGDLARAVGKRTRNLADEAQTKVTSSSREAKRRADAALDALAGKRPARPWGWMAGLAAAGLVVGWFAATFGKRAVVQAQAMLEHDEADDPIFTRDDAQEVTPGS